MAVWKYLRKKRVKLNKSLREKVDNEEEPITRDEHREEEMGMFP